MATNTLPLLLIIKYSKCKDTLNSFIPVFISCNFISIKISELPNRLKIFSIKVLDLKKRNYICNAVKVTKQQKGAIAQLVEQRTENTCVAGSNPDGTSGQALSTLREGVFLLLPLNDPYI